MAAAKPVGEDRGTRRGEPSLFLVDGSDSMGLRAGGRPSRWEEATAWVGEASAGLGEARAVVFAAEAGPPLPVGGLAGEPPGDRPTCRRRWSGWRRRRPGRDPARSPTR
ncbi:MAG: hypothetical protein R3F11_02910 [Verrucomicrobiales bacterium]